MFSFEKWGILLSQEKENLMNASHAEDQHKEYIGAELRRFGREAGEEKLQVVSPFEPAGDQPQAIEKLAQGIEDGLRYQTLLGVTGSGKTFSMAKTIEKLKPPHAYYGAQ